MQTVKTGYPCVTNYGEMNLEDFVRKNRSLTSFATLILGLSLAVTARAQSSGTIDQLFAFTCTTGTRSDMCPLGARPDLILQASDGNFYGAAQVTDQGVSDPQGGTLFKLPPSGESPSSLHSPRAAAGS
jgi:hypothetical protein